MGQFTFTGDPGTHGTDGVPGTNGDPGAHGTNGANGSPGPTGPSGATGPTGASGSDENFNLGLLAGSAIFTVFLGIPMWIVLFFGIGLNNNFTFKRRTTQT